MTKRAIDLTGKMGTPEPEPEPVRPRAEALDSSGATPAPAEELFGFVDIPRLLEIESARRTVLQVVFCGRDITARFFEGHDVEGWVRWQDLPGREHGRLRFYARGAQGYAQGGTTW